MPEIRHGVTFTTAEQAARAHGIATGAHGRPGGVYQGEVRLGRSWAAWGAALVQQGVVMQEGEGYLVVQPLPAPLVASQTVAARTARALLPPASPPVPAVPSLPLPSMPPRPYPRPSTPPRPAAVRLDDEAAREVWVDRQARTPARDRWRALQTWTELLTVPAVLIVEGDVPIEVVYTVAISWHAHSRHSLDGYPVRRTPRYYVVGFNDNGDEAPGELDNFASLGAALAALEDDLEDPSSTRLRDTEEIYSSGEGEHFCHSCLVCEIIGDSKEDAAVLARFGALLSAGPVEGKRCDRCEAWAREDDQALRWSSEWRREHRYVNVVAAVVIRGMDGRPMIREHIDAPEGRFVRDWLQGVLVASVEVPSRPAARPYLTGRCRVHLDVPPCVAGKLESIMGQRRSKAAAQGKCLPRRADILSSFATEAIERHFTSTSLLGERYTAVLAQVLRQGGTIHWSDGYVLADNNGEVQALGLSVRELSLALASLDGRALFKAALPVRVGRLLPQVQQVLGAGESLSAFIRQALRAEITWREQEQGGDLDLLEGEQPAVRAAVDRAVVALVEDGHALA